MSTENTLDLATMRMHRQLGELLEHEDFDSVPSLINALITRTANNLEITPGRLVTRLDFDYNDTLSENIEGMMRERDLDV